MTQRDNILQELKELETSVLNFTPQNVFFVPSGYFDGLAALMLAKVKALDSKNAADEISFLSPVISNLSKQSPYHVPAGYFDGLAENIQRAVTGIEASQTTNEELIAISPFLSSIRKQMPYTVPKEYFENTAQTATVIADKRQAEVVSFTSRKWFRYAAAAVVTSVIAITAFLFINNEKPDATTNSHAWVKKNIKKVSTDKINEFIKLAEEEKLVENAVVSTDKKMEIKELVKDIPVAEIQNFLDEIDVGDNSADDEMILN